MKKTLFILTFLLILIKLSPICAQRQQSVYAEFLGNGLTFSFNYDTRFTSKVNGIGMRAGIGYLGLDDEGVVTLPLQANYLLGKEGKFFELGLGATFILGTGDLFDEDTGHVIGTMTFGYRKQPVDGGFMWKIAITPLIYEGGFFPLFGGVGFGYAF